MLDRNIPQILALVPLVLTLSGCAHHHAAMCPNPAKLVGTNSRDSQEAWVIVRADRSVPETATRIAATYHVRTQPLTYVHGFSLYPVPEGSALLCDKAVVEIHYAAPQAVAAR
jgi:hypothetical protein